MLYFCIPVHNEAPTIGVLLWRLRKVFQEFSREYEVLVYDDASTDGTAETLAPYARVLPLTVLGGSERVGYARALEELLRAASRRTRYPRRDAIITLQGDFTDQPEHVPELIRRFEGGADVVVAERPLTAAMPTAVRRLRRAAPWALRPFATVPGVSDPFSTFRLYRVSVIRDMMREFRIAGPHTEGWAANAAMLVRLARHARRIEAVTLESRYDLRLRESRVRPWADAVGIFRTGRELRSGRAGYQVLSAVEVAEPRTSGELDPDARPALKSETDTPGTDESRDRSRRSRRGGSRGGRGGRGDPGERPRGEASAGQDRQTSQESQHSLPDTARDAQNTEQARPRGQQPPRNPKRPRPGPRRDAGGTAPESRPDGAAEGTAAAGTASPEPTLGLVDGAADSERPAPPDGEAARPRRRRGGRSRRRARSSDEGPSSA